MSAHASYAVRLAIPRRPLLSQVDEQTDEQIRPVLINLRYDTFVL
jgi:hypothetical protein